MTSKGIFKEKVEKGEEMKQIMIAYINSKGTD